MTAQQATAEVFFAAFKALSKREQEVILTRIARDRKLRRILENISDLAFLSRLGLVELKEARRGVPQAPTLPYDEIDLNLRIRL